MNLFVYGSLLSGEVLIALLGRIPPLKSATLTGFKRYALHGVSYPVMIPTNSPLDSVRGQVLYNLTDRETKILDKFEGDQYIRTEVDVEIEDSDEKEKVFTYVKNGSYDDHQFNGEWDYEYFREHHLARFLKVYAGWNK